MMRRRQFLSSLGMAAAMPAQSALRPNILWITCEDMSSHLGSFGDKYANSPEIDAFAAKSLRYTCCSSNAPVCAPARTTIISGIYPPALGAEHMRSATKLGAGQKMFPQILREAGYYTSNNSKEDYNVAKTGTVWDESSPRAHWRKRKPGQPFFSVFNFTITHESQVRTRPHQLRHSPAEVHVPAYQPDTPEARHDWAQNYDNILTMDGLTGKVLGELRADGLDQDTIVFFYSDHGTGMPRSKRWPYDSGLRVPLIVHFPEKFRSLATSEYRPGAATDRPVSFVDLAPTVLSLTGLPRAAYHQGFAFLGRDAAPRQPFIYGFRGRMDERYDLVRSVTDGRYVYLRHYMPHRIYGQHISYMFETPTTQVWKKMYDEGKLNEVQRRFWEPKPSEELYDLKNDPDEVKNLAGSPAHAAILKKMRQAQESLAARIRDIGFLPENEIHERAGSGAPYDAARKMHNLPAIQAMAGKAAARDPKLEGALLNGLKDSDSAVRYWAAMGLLMREKFVPLRPLLQDPAPAVRIVAAEALGRFGEKQDIDRALDVLLEYADMTKHGVHLALMALNAVDYMDSRAASVKARLAALPTEKAGLPRVLTGYVPRLKETVLEGLP